MTTEAETIFVSPDGDAGQEHELVPSLSIAICCSNERRS